MNTTISDAAVESALNAYDRIVQSHAMSKDSDAMRAALAAALPHIHPQPAELAEQQGDVLLPCPFCGESAERIDFGPGAGDNEGGSCVACTGCGTSGPVEFGFKENFRSIWNCRALAATGKQQVGEVEGAEGFDIDDVRELFETHAKGRDLTPDTWGVSSYVDPFVDNDWNEWAAAWKAIAARQPVASNQVVEKIEQLDVDSSPAQGVDLGQFIALAKFGEEFAFSAEKQPHSRVVYSQASRLRALIDGQAEVSNGAA